MSKPNEYDFIKSYKLSQLKDIENSVNAINNARNLQDITHSNEQVLSIVKSSVSALLANPDEEIKKLKSLAKELEELEVVLKHRSNVEQFIHNYPETAQALNLSEGTESVDAVDKRFVAMSEPELTAYVEDRKEVKKLSDKFEVIATDNFSDSSESLHLLNAAKMANILDTRIISYVDNHAPDIRTLKSMLKSKQKFPKVLFGDLKQAFPCILAGIRDYATYIPLEKDLFDLVQSLLKRKQQNQLENLGNHLKCDSLTL